VTPFAEAPEALEVTTAHAVAVEARRGLTSVPRTLSPWLFYDALGSHLFEQITALPEYYLTRIERDLFRAHASEMLRLAAREMPLTLVELGAGTATKTGILLEAAVQHQPEVLYQPIDVSETALIEAADNIERHLPGVAVHSQIADYTASAFTVERPRDHRVLALYIGSSIGNFAPEEAAKILGNLRAQLQFGDTLLLGIDLAPSRQKPVDTLLAAYDDAAGVTAAFNRNILDRLNRELRSSFRPESFRHQARWNASDSRIEMHLESLAEQTVHVPANSAGPGLMLNFHPGDTIHTENSYKFTEGALAHLLHVSHFAEMKQWRDERDWFSVILAEAI